MLTPSQEVHKSKCAATCAGASQNLDQGILSGQVQGQQGQGQGAGQPHKQQTGQQQPEQDGPAFHDSEFPVLGSGGGARCAASQLLSASKVWP